jgi:hypothetical protein
LLAATKRYWCDGILGPEWEEDYRPEHVAVSQQITLRAWVDEGRTQGRNAKQTLYKLVVRLGQISLDNYVNTGELANHLPAIGLVGLDVKRQIIEIQLP